MVFLAILPQPFPQKHVLDNRIAWSQSVQWVILKELKIFILSVIYYKCFRTNFTGQQDNLSYKNKHFLACGYPECLKSIQSNLWRNKGFLLWFWLQSPKIWKLLGFLMFYCFFPWFCVTVAHYKVWLCCQWNSNLNRLSAELRFFLMGDREMSVHPEGKCWALFPPALGGGSGHRGSGIAHPWLYWEVWLLS